MLKVVWLAKMGCIYGGWKTIEGKRNRIEGRLSVGSVGDMKGRKRKMIWREGRTFKIRESDEKS